MAVEGEKEKEKETLPAADECHQQMLTTGGDSLLGSLDDSGRPLSISAPFPVGLQSSKGRRRTCQGDNPRLIEYSRRRDAGA